MKFKRILIIFIVGFCLFGLFGCKNATITYKDPYYAEPKELTIKKTSDPEEVKESLYAIVLSNNPVKDITEESLDIEFKTNLAFKDEEGVEQKVAIKGTIETDIVFTKPEYIISTSDIISGYSGSGKLTFSGSVPNSSGKIESFSKSTIAFYVESGMLYATFDLDKTFVNFIKKENEKAGSIIQLINNNTIKYVLERNPTKFTYKDSLMIEDLLLHNEGKKLSEMLELMGYNLREIREPIDSFVDEAGVTISKVRGSAVTISLDFPYEFEVLDTEIEFNINVNAVIDVAEVYLSKIEMKVSSNNEVLNGSIDLSLETTTKARVSKISSREKEDAVDINSIIK